MLLAVVSGYVSLPMAPTRRISMGDTALELDGSFHVGATLLAAIASTSAPRLDDDNAMAIETLMSEVEAGHIVRQPRVRHRLQKDHVGLKYFRHGLYSLDDHHVFDIDHTIGTPAQHFLAATYAIAAQPLSHRQMLCDAVRFGMTWTDAIDGRFSSTVAANLGSFSHLSGGSTDWAMSVLDLATAPNLLEKKDVMMAFRTKLVDVHPDRGADAAQAAQRISDITEAKKLLIASL